MSSSVSSADVVAAIARMSPEERAAVSAALGSTPSGPATAKLSHVLDPLPDADVAKVVAACRAGLKVAADEPGAGEDKIGAPLLSAHPGVFAAAQANSMRRRKPLVHSLHAVAIYLGRRAPTTAATAGAEPAARGAK